MIFPVVPWRRSAALFVAGVDLTQRQSPRDIAGRQGGFLSAVRRVHPNPVANRCHQVPCTCRWVPCGCADAVPPEQEVDREALRKRHINSRICGRSPRGHISANGAAPDVTSRRPVRRGRGGRHYGRCASAVRKSRAAGHSCRCQAAREVAESPGGHDISSSGRGRCRPPLVGVTIYSSPSTSPVASAWLPYCVMCGVGGADGASNVHCRVGAGLAEPPGRNHGAVLLMAAPLDQRRGTR